MSSKYRNCSPPTDGLDPEGRPWTNQSWREQAKLELKHFESYVKNPRLAAALARALPADARLTTPLLTRLVPPRGGLTSEKGKGCPYCLCRPLPPPDQAQESCPLNYLYGTGNGAHSPYFCRPLIRFLCEGGGDEVSDDLKGYLRSLVILRDPQPPR